MAFLRYIITTFSIGFFFISAAAQDDRYIESWVDTFNSRQASFLQTQVYLHIDKSVYVNNENIWFKGYILYSPVEFEKQHTLFVFLSDRISNKVVISEKFVLIDGLSAGSLYIPDSLREGDYNLVAYTNILPEEKNPIVFQQLVSIRKPKDEEEKYTFRFENAIFTSITDTVSFMCRIVNNKSKYAKDAVVVYKVLANDKVIATGKNKINQFGELPVSFLPIETADKFEIQALIISGKDSFTTRQPLSFLEKKINLRWFPESGDLIENISTKIVVEAIALTGKPVVVKGQLLEDGIPIATINTNEAGLGIIAIKTSASKKYSVQLQDGMLQTIIMNFPVVRKKGYTISVEKGVVGDTIFAYIHKYGTGNTFHLLVHNYEQIFSLSELQMPADKLLVKIPASDINPGLVTLTVLDSKGKPCAERTVFNGYDELPVMTIEKDSLQYSKRSKVNIKVNVKDRKGNPLTGVFSMACVLAKRIDTTSYQDITPYYYFNNYIQHGLIQKSYLFGISDKETMELFLLSRCWTRYKYPVVDSTVATFAKNKRLDVSGYVLYKNKKVKKPVKLILVGSGTIEEIMTDELGLFTISPSLLAMQADQKANLFISDKDRINYQVFFNDDVISLEKKLATCLYPLISQVKPVLPEEEKKGLNNIITLTTVVVKSKSDNNIWDEFKSRDCNDYVCMYNILNCTNHKSGGIKPMDGGVYTYMNKQIVYRACAGEQRDFFLKIKGRYYPKEFYKADYEKFNAPDPEIYSTVYWLPQILTDKNGEALVSFYTNDMAGIFSIVIEGISQKGVVNGKKFIKVIP